MIKTVFSNTFFYRDKMPFHDVPVLGDLLSLGDVILASVLALFVTLFILRFKRIVMFFFGPNEDFRIAELNRIIKRCYTLFPNEIFNFRGKTFTRGMIIRVTTRAQKTFEGRLLGLNDSNMICVMTQNHIAADILDNILDIVIITDENEND